MKITDQKIPLVDCLWISLDALNRDLSKSVPDAEYFLCPSLTFEVCGAILFVCYCASRLHSDFSSSTLSTIWQWCYTSQSAIWEWCYTSRSAIWQWCYTECNLTVMLHTQECNLTVMLHILECNLRVMLHILECNLRVSYTSWSTLCMSSKMVLLANLKWKSRP